MLKSLLTLDNPFNTTEQLQEWIENRNREVGVDVQLIPFSEMEGWLVDEDGCLRHNSGKFFSIVGIHVETDYGLINSWEQPIINQPEVGFLGILTKEIDGVLYFLMQAKIEPGNVNCVQISPTLQATKSNYSRVHKGKKPAYLDYFLNVKPENVLLDQLQSEQGARFLRKRNRNIIIKVDEDIDLLPDFRWMTLGQIKQFMTMDNMVNMDTRTVLSGVDFSEYITPLTASERMSTFGHELIRSLHTGREFHDMGPILSWLTGLKARYDLIVTHKPLNQLKGWHSSATDIANDNSKYFRIIGTRVAIDNREVSSWCQPLVQPMQQGICAFVLKRINGTIHFLVQAKMECGNYDVFELAPTVQSLTDNFRAYSSENRAKFTDYVLQARPEQILYDVLQSEEGGRFYREQNRNMIVMAEDDFQENLPERYRWMTLGQIYRFLKFNNYINIQARSLLSALNYL